LPGGKVENKENFENALIREFKEETNLDIIIISKFYSSTIVKNYNIHTAVC